MKAKLRNILLTNPSILKMKKKYLLSFHYNLIGETLLLFGLKPAPILIDVRDRQTQEFLGTIKNNDYINILTR